MLDVRRIRMETEAVKAALRKRSDQYDAVIDEILEIDEQRRVISTATDDLKSRQNKASKEIPALKKEGKDTTALMADLKELSDRIKENDGKIAELEAKQRGLLLNIPNTPHESVPEGKDDQDNVEVRRKGEPRKFDFEPLPHWDLGAALGILDPERAAKVTGTRFHFVRGDGARLERAILNFYLDQHGKKGYTEITPPYLVNRDSMTGTGQLPKFEEDAFKLTDPDYFLVPTAEVPVTNYFRDEILDGKQLPIRFCSFSACFRKEAGSAGRDTRGLIRQHQFMKVEMVKFAKPEESFDELESMVADAEHLLELLGLPCRTMLLCGGDIGFGAAKCYDVEVWMPSYGRYVEISSCSNTQDFQARRAGIRFKNEQGEKARFVHTLNGSGLPIGRTVAAILENFQNADGTVTVPQALQPYFGKDRIEPCRI